MWDSLVLVVLLGVGASAQQWPDGAGVFNVVKFGAVGDGKTDCHPAFSRAVENVTAAGGGTLFVPAGQFALSQAVVLSGSNIKLLGAGMTLSSLVALTGNSTLVVFDGCGQCGLSSMRLSHAAARSTHASIAATGIATDFTGLGRRARASAPAATTTPCVVASSGAAVTIRRSFWFSASQLWIERVWVAVSASHMANTVTLLDSILLNLLGPSGVRIEGGADGQRVDIVQISRLTANVDQTNGTGFNRSVVWVDIGPGANTVRLDNVGLINGGTGVRMWAPKDEPAGVAPGRPLFVLCNDLEVDFPRGNAVELQRGEEFQLSNGYLQGGGTGAGRLVQSSTAGSGIYVGPQWNSEIMITNTRIFGNKLSGVELAGGVNALLSNNVVADNGGGGKGLRSGVLIRSGVGDFVLQGNSVGAAMKHDR